MSVLRQICASSDENAELARAFEEHRGQLGDSRVDRC